MHPILHAQENLDLLSDYEATLCFSVDATLLNRHFKSKKFHKIIFNFPHLGHGIKDQDRNIRAHQLFLHSFLKSAKDQLNLDGCIYVTLKTGLPYDEWNIKKQAQMVGLATLNSFAFNPPDYEGYEHRRTIEFQERVSTTDVQKSKCKHIAFAFIKKA